MTMRMEKSDDQNSPLNVPGSELLILGMVIPPLMTGNPYNGSIIPLLLVDDHPLLHGNNGSLDHSTNGDEFPWDPNP